MRMAGLRTALVLALGLVIAVSCEDVPVFVWGDLEHTGQRSNPLERISGPEFESELRPELKSRPFFVAFVEETLSVEDLSQRYSDGETALPYLQNNLRKSIYLPAVQDSVKTLNRVVEPDYTERVKLTESGVEGEARAGTRYLLVELSDAREDEARADLLRRHNHFMEQMVEKLREQYGPVVAAYTAHYPSWSIVEEPARVRRHLMQASENATTSDTLHAYNISGDMLIVLKGIKVTPNNGAPVSVDMPEGGPTLTKNETGGNSMTLLFDSTNYTIKLIFIADDGYWFLNEADITSKLNPSDTEVVNSKKVYAPLTFSYHCGSSVQFSGPNATFTLTIEDMQVQPFFSGGGEHFGDYYDCVGYMTAPIWSGLLVVFIMLAIFFYGVGSMMDLRTMDRFDDPKGKTITINAQAD